MICNISFKGTCGFCSSSVEKKLLAVGFFWLKAKSQKLKSQKLIMKLSPKWIRKFVHLTVDDRRLAADLTAAGIAVEGVSGTGADTVFEMEIGTNRPDAMNHYGVAREAAAIYDLAL